MKIKLTRKEKRTIVQRSIDIVPILTDYIRSLDKYEKVKEHFLVVALKPNLEINFIDVISIGSLIGTVVGIQEVFRRAIIEGNTSRLIIAHNHPSNSRKPSEVDVRLSKKLVAASKLLELEIIDSIILTTSKGYTSLGDEGLL